jgi:hypothetical protein
MSGSLKQETCMTTSYRVLDMRTEMTSPAELTVARARSPEDAARQALGLDLVRSGHRRDLIARVYWQPEGQPVTMVRLYRRVGEQAD